MNLFNIGDRIEVKTKTQTYTGLVMPSPEHEKDLLIIKLSSGYNLPIKLTKEINVKKIGSESFEGLPAYKPPINKNLPSISIITTGGTITSRVDYKTGAVSPLKSAEELLLTIPELADIVNIRKIIQPFSLLSEDMTFREWQAIAKAVADEINTHDCGVIVTHGTDILHYTAAALSFMLRNLSKPVAVVGGQRSSDRGSFDGAMNLICAAHYCKSDIAEVAVVMHANSSDDICLANRGVNVRKMHTSRRDTFRPINELPLAKIHPNGEIELVNSNHKKRKNEETVADTRFEEKVVLLKYFPGADPELLYHMIEKGYRGIVIEATGLGHVSVNPLNKKTSWLPAIQEAVQKGIVVCFAPQTIYGKLDPYVYTNARILLDAGVVFLENMLAETAYVKLGWILGHTQDIDEAKKLMKENLAGEIIDRILPETFLY
ncbi:MAG: Glu-tRNA(Gln) amidotransferase subunit GatD [archaeon]